MFQWSPQSVTQLDAKYAPLASPTLTGTTTISGPLAHTGSSVGLNGNPVTAKAVAITTPTAPGAAYVQAEAAAMKTAVDAIRVALTNIGITL